MLALGAQAQVNQQILGEKHAMLRIDAQKKYLLLPVQESQENAATWGDAQEEQGDAL